MEIISHSHYILLKEELMQVYYGSILAHKFLSASQPLRSNSDCGCHGEA